MSNSQLIAVASRSFSIDPFLRSELLKKHSHIKFNDSGKSLAGKELIDFLSGAEKAIIALEKINSETLSQLPHLKLISKYGVGLDNIDFEALKKHNIQLAWKGGVNKISVAELALHFMLGCARGSFHSHHEVQKNIWVQFKGQNLSEKTIGILGLGHVGQELVKMLKPFRVKILGYDLHQKNLADVEQTSLERVLTQSDIVSIHLPHTTKTHHVLSKERLEMMKAGSFLINTARGGLVDEEALFELLKSKKIQSAAFDVFAEEPPKNRDLINLDNFFATAHIGGSSIQSIHLMGLAAIEGLEQGKVAEPSNFFDYPL